MSASFTGKVAVVTGASKGIGAEIARQLAAAGASVVVNYSSSKAGADVVVAAIIAAGGKATAIQANVSEEADMVRLFAETVKLYGRLDVLVNNAGIYEFSPLETITAEHFHRQFNTNVLGLLFATREAAKHMGEGSSIVNVSSAISTLAMPAASVYSATKASVDAITRTLGLELGPRKIRVNAVNPGMVHTEGTQSAGINASDFEADYVARTSLGRVGQVGDISPAVLYLASADSSWVTGQTLVITGGYN